ncbi:hypothetical protein BDF21DRAFT_452560 [Thamnidium elegans]|nr:hypothetical protein BDF21DRAFT_452560 [Thamnidium elegans]
MSVQTNTVFLRATVVHKSANISMNENEKIKQPDHAVMIATNAVYEVAIKRDNITATSIKFLSIGLLVPTFYILLRKGPYECQARSDDDSYFLNQTGYCLMSFHALTIYIQVSII